jgi:tetratricopeptide (TPR) repeat protein
VEPKRQLAIMLHNLAALVAQTDLATARQYSADAIEIQQRLVAAHPELITLRDDMALSYNNLAGFWVREGKWEEAEREFKKAIEIESHLAALAPEVVRHQSDLAISQNHIGDLMLTTQRYPEALAAFRRAAEILEELVQRAPQSITYCSDLGAVLFNQGEAQLAMKHDNLARLLWEQGLTHQQRAVNAAPLVAHFRNLLNRQKQRYEYVFGAAQIGRQIDGQVEPVDNNNQDVDTEDMTVWDTDARQTITVPEPRKYSADQQRRSVGIESPDHVNR